MLERGKGEQLDDGALEFAHVSLHVIGDEVEDLVGDRVLEMIHLRLSAQDGDAVLQVRRRDVGDHSPLETALQAVFKARNLRRRPVGGEHDLAAGFVQCVECVKEFFLRLLLAGEDVDVVDEQQVGLAVTPLEVIHRAVLDGVDDVVEELLGGDICDPDGGVALQDPVGDGLHQVGLSEAGGAIDEERVIRLARRFGDRRGGRGGELVGLADDEMVESISIIQLAQNDGIIGLYWLDSGVRLRHKEIHLRARPALVLDLEDDLERMPEADRAQAFEVVEMLGIDPVDRELVGGGKGQREPVEFCCGQRGEPLVGGMCRQVVTRAVEDPGPGVVGGQGHWVGQVWKTQGGRCYPARVEKSTLVSPNQFRWVDLSPSHGYV